MKVNSFVLGLIHSVFMMLMFTVDIPLPLPNPYRFRFYYLLIMILFVILTLLAFKPLRLPKKDTFLSYWLLCCRIAFYSTVLFIFMFCIHSAAQVNLLDALKGENEINWFFAVVFGLPIGIVAGILSLVTTFFYRSFNKKSDFSDNLLDAN